MSFAEAEIVLLQLFRHPDLFELEKENEELEFLLSEMIKRVRMIKFHKLGYFFTLLDSKSEEILLRYKKICKRNLEF
ncbi:MAG: hypothetical protein KAJ58_01235 [Candidatus Pacebacteria bacterium]|nr:hypothetical protein [Candidatus Paceibacterota bacterium]